MIMQIPTFKQAEESLIYLIENYQNKKVPQHNWQGCAAV